MSTEIVVPCLSTDPLELRYAEGGFGFEYTSMYDPPEPITYELLRKLVDWFGTDKINVDHDDISCPGCETCDYGSRYGHTVYVYGATRNVPSV